MHINRMVENGTEEGKEKGAFKLTMEERNWANLIWLGVVNKLKEWKRSMDMESLVAEFLEMASRWRRIVPEPNRGEPLLEEMDKVKRKFEVVSSRFDQQNDPDLLEECIYQMQALTARNRYLTREAKRQGVRKERVRSLQRI